jgi:FMN-dependent NADH-azoreductase
MRLLNIQSSPRGPRSVSIAVADAFLEAYRKACPGLVVDTLNVWEENLPEFDGQAIGAKYKGINGKPMDEVEATVWDRIQGLAARFKSADRIVIGVPMWNFGYPYKLKQLIDLASQRNMLFTYDGRVYGRC